MRRIDILDTRQQPAATTPPPGGYAMKTIDFETHFATQGWVDALYANEGYPQFRHDPVSKNRRLFYFPGGGEPYGDVIIDKLLETGRATACSSWTRPASTWP